MKLSRIIEFDYTPVDNCNIIDSLPNFIKKGCMIFDDDNEKMTYLFSALGVLSGCLPNYTGCYDGKWISPNLYVYILAPYGTGKGSMIYARYLGKAIDSAKKARTRLNMSKYQQAQSKKGNPDKKQSQISNDVMLELPPNEMLYIPADISKSALIDTLNDNHGTGIIFETEGETLCTALKQDYGGYLDVILKAFHHEPSTFLRRQGRESKEVNSPRLSMILSSTFFQFLAFRNSAEDGLVSRFLFHLLPGSKEFRDVFAARSETRESTFTEMGIEVEKLYDKLSSLETPIYFCLTDPQKEYFLAYFGGIKKNDEDAREGDVHRLAVITFRVAMILSIFRQYEHHTENCLGEYIKCTDIDFRTAFEISTIIYENIETVHAMLPQKKKVIPGNYDELFEDLPDEFTTKEVVEKGKKLKFSKRKAERFLEKDDRVEKISHGKYKKIK